MENNLHPNKSETEFLRLAYNKFYDIFKEIFNDSFWKKNPYYRFSREREAFFIYAEILYYEPISCVIKMIKKKRPPMESEISSELFKFIRNIFSHFPFFDNWDEVWVNKSLVNWYKVNQSIDRFLNKYAGRAEIKYRYWEPVKKRMTYLSINFPTNYNYNDKIFLKDIILEKEGIKFSLILMKNIMDTQVIKD